MHTVPYIQANKVLYTLDCFHATFASDQDGEPFIIPLFVPTYTRYSEHSSTMPRNEVDTAIELATMDSPEFSSVLQALRDNPSSPPPSARDAADLSTLVYYAEARALLRREHLSLQAYCPIIAAFTLVILIGIVLPFPTSRAWHFPHLLDLAAVVPCLPLTWSGRVRLVTLSSHIAVAYLTWTKLPAPHRASKASLPTHEDFMLSLETTVKSPDDTRKGGDDEDSCMVCWGSEEPLAVLPCRHSTCKSCLSSMASRGQTACPLCRAPLFRLRSDTYWIRWQKARISLYASNLISLTITFAYHVRRGEYTVAGLNILTLLCTLLPSCVTGYCIWQRGEDWWRDEGTRPGASTWSSVKTMVALAAVVAAFNWYQHHFVFE